MSVCSTTEGLYDYLLATEAELDGVLVGLEGERAEDVDFDADQGALLVIPTEVIAATPIDRAAVDAVRGRSAALAGR